MKVLFVQLPLQDPNGDSAQANIPLAAAYLSAYAESRNLLSRGDWSVLDRGVADFGSDTAIVEAIAASGADLVGFTLYAWNLERSIHVAERSLLAAPRARLVAGGPEVVSGMKIFSRSPFHSLVEGEGEEAFCELLDDIRRSKPLAKRYCASHPLDLTKLPNPYLAGTLPFEADRPVHLETMRGCPMHCGYCFYGKNSGDLRRHPRAQAIEVVEAAGRAGVRELYLMDPSFHASEDLSGRLVDLARANSGGMSLHAEIRLESVTEEIGRLYAAAGLVSAEVGLQSVNPKALEAVQRTWDRPAFERGAEVLNKNRVIVKTGVILGLPFDGYEQVIETYDFQIGRAHV